MGGISWRGRDRELSALCHRLHWQLQLNRHSLYTDWLSQVQQYRDDMHLSSCLLSSCPHISNGIVSCSHVCIPYSQLTHSVDPLDLFPFLFITGDLNDCLVEEKSTMKYVVRSDLTTKIIQKRHFLGLHLQPSQFHQFSDFCNTSGVFVIQWFKFKAFTGRHK